MVSLAGMVGIRDSRDSITALFFRINAVDSSTAWALLLDSSRAFFNGVSILFD